MGLRACQSSPATPYGQVPRSFHRRAVDTDLAVYNQRLDTAAGNIGKRLGQQVIQALAQVRPGNLVCNVEVVRPTRLVARIATLLRTRRRYHDLIDLLPGEHQE